MGDVISISAVKRIRRRPPEPGHFGEIAFFTGVRVERWCELKPERPDPPADPAPRSPRGGRRRKTP